MQADGEDETLPIGIPNYRMSAESGQLQDISG